jgi:hypothetical protein
MNCAHAILLAFVYVACVLSPTAAGAAEQLPSVPPIPGEYHTIDQLWAGIDPTADPLDVQVVEQWSADGIDYRKLYFTCFGGRP